MGLKEKIVSIDKKHLFILILLFLLAFGIRANLMKYELFFEFDTYWHARVGSYILQGEGVPDRDPLAYYQLGGSTIGWKIAPVFWFLSTAIYSIFTLGLIGYDKELWIAFVKFLPAFYGALISVAVYFLFKEIYNKKAGYVASFIAAVTPAFVYRTMAGQFEDDSLGFLWMVIGFYFFVKAVKEMNFTRNSIKNAVLSALFFGLMAWTWEMFMLIPLILVFYVITTAVLMWFNKIETKKITHLLKVFAIVFILFGVIATAKDEGHWIKRDISYITRYIPVNQENINRFTGQSSEREGIFGMTVGEENTGIQFFGTKYNALIIFPILALLIVFYRFILFPLINYIFNLKEKNKWETHDYFAFIIFYWVGITLFMAWSKLKFTYTFGLAVAIGAGLVGYFVFEFIKSRTLFEKKVVGVAFALMLLIGIASGTFFMTQNTPNIEYTLGWKPALKWLSESTPKDAKMFNWWDEGHWITFIGERAALIDNRNIDLNADIMVAKFILSENEEEANKIVENYGSDYLIFGSDLLEKHNSMVLFAFLDEPEKKNTELGKYLEAVMRCSANTDKLSGVTTYNCGGNSLSTEAMNSIPTKYITQPNQLYNERVPIFIYREKNNSVLYMFNDAANNSMINKLWFDDPAIKNFALVYDSTDDNAPGVKIFKVIK
ncbi:glycosyltransferase family 39 protein [Candidatus Micrarchaeota archaeon]|nr:glycosyltransferase family 39 protein [Candidatus Micrarchaeota archaeon]